MRGWEPHDVLVNGEGPAPCDLFLCGEGPGWKEVSQHRPFVGATGDELNRLLASIGWSRRDFFLSNLYRMLPPGKNVPYTAEQLALSEPYLHRELKRANPSIIVAMGRQAARYFLGDVDINEVWGLHLTPPPELRARLPFLRPDVTIAPLVHIAAGFHNPESSSYVVAGFQELKRILAGEVVARDLYADAFPSPCYMELETVEEFDAWFGDNEPSVLHIDTEGYAWAPWSVQLSKAAGEAVLIRATNKAVIERLRQFLAWTTSSTLPFSVTLHNGLYDIKVLRALGIDLIQMGVRVDDTMLQAYELGILPQGLKPLCTRLEGMRMQSYDEVLGDAQNRLIQTHMTWLWDELNEEQAVREQAEFVRLTTTPYTTKAGLVKPGRKLKTVPHLPHTKLQKAVERVMGSKEPARLWNGQVIDLHVESYRRLGPAPEATLSHVDYLTGLNYACRDADGTGRVRDDLEPRLDAMAVRDVYELDLGTYPIIDRMMQTGIYPDPEAFARLATLLDRELAELNTRLWEATTNTSFNANSGDQVAEFLYDRLGLDSMGRTVDSGRGSTNDKVLEALQREYPDLPVIEDIRSYREYYKLLWTFVRRLPDLVNRWPADGRIHCELKLTRTPSGRLAAAKPNLLAMPKHGKFAKDFRRCFVAQDDRVFLSSDLSQAELRVLAHLSQDPYMLAVYRGEVRNPDGSLIDLHAGLAHRIFGVMPKDQDESKHRLPSKTVNFGLPMGMTKVGLALELRKNGLDVDEDDAQKWIDEADKLYAAVPAYKLACCEEARTNGFVRCLSGRIRYIGGIRSRNEAQRSEAERFAFSTKIQEGAQTLGKGMLAAAWRDIFVPLRKAGRWIEPVLWIHDDLLSELEADLVFEVVPALVKIMSAAPSWFTVPVQTDPKVGVNWADLLEAKW